jgi:hypothetical protein
VRGRRILGTSLAVVSVHDELVLVCPGDDARDVVLWLKEKMRSSIEDVLGKDLGGEKSVEVSYGPVCTAVVYANVRAAASPLRGGDGDEPLRPLDVFLAKILQ